MTIADINNSFLIVNFLLETVSIIIISFVFFDLLYVDKNVHLTMLSETFEKFKRYDIFKSSLIFLVLHLYFTFLGKISIYLRFANIFFAIFTFIGNLFLIIFVFKLYRLIHNYAPKAEKEK
jgi:hypothetical protein